MSKYVGRIITDQAPAGYSVSTTSSGAGFLSVASNAAFAMGTGNFTIECWARATTTSGYGYLFQIGDFVTGVYIYRNTGSTKVIVGALGGDRFTQTSTPAVDTWNHYALVRSGNTLTLYFNGIADGSVTVTGENYTSNTLRIASAAAGYSGYEYTGYISNFRIVKGTALYTAAFTPPTQLLNVTNTSILTCNSPAIVDQSSNTFAITTNGNAAASTFTPFVAYNPAPTSSNPLTPAPGVWSLDEALQYTQQGVWPSYPANAIEDVFSTYLYTGTGATRTITNNIDLSGKGGMVWIKNRNNSRVHQLLDTVRGVWNALDSASTGASSADGSGLTAFNNNGFTIGSSGPYNFNTETFASWTFREQAKFFDVVTYTGTGSAQTINHNLGSVPGCIIIKCFSSAADWPVYHRGLTSPATTGIYLNSADPEFNVGSAWWNSTAPTSTQFSVGTSGNTNNSGQSYVAYLFAHDAGGFGAAGTDNVISCGVFTYSAGTEVNLGYEPQWILVKRRDIATAGSWYIIDAMRGWTTDSNASWLIPNSSGAEASGAFGVAPTSTGFRVPTGYGSGSPYIYIAIRRGPMRPPTTSTSVFSTSTYSANTGTITSGFPTDFIMTLDRATGTAPWNRGFADRLRGAFLTLSSAATSAENNNSSTTSFDSNTGTILNGGSVYGSSYVYEQFRRAPGFFDVVCYAGTGASRSLTHNLTITPELVITKSRTNGSLGWVVWHKNLISTNYWVRLDDTMAQSNSPIGYGGTFSASNYTISNTGPYDALNGSGQNFVAYLFATVGGVSKVGSYTGTGTTQQINCGFTNGSRFVMIKRIDSTGDWYVWDSARGIVAGNDPYLLLNNTNAEVTNTDFVDTYSLGFELSSTAPAGLNASGGTYIFLAIA